MRMTDEVWKQLEDINIEFNRDIKYTTDLKQFDKSDFWELVENKGDCDDYAVCKRHKLREVFPGDHDSFRLATCWVEGDGGLGTGGYHAVLVIITDMGDYVMDNRHTAVMPWDVLPYKWHKREKAGDKIFWEEINN